MALNIFKMLELINARLAKIEANIERIDEKMDHSIALQRNHLIRVKNNQPIDDEMILQGRPYNDLAPEKARSIYHNQNLDFILLDVSRPHFTPSIILEEAIKIPFEDLPTRYAEISNKLTPILVISEIGLRSIQACELLAKKGYYNLNNISGGYHFWPKDEEFLPPPPIGRIG